MNGKKWPQSCTCCNCFGASRLAFANSAPTSQDFSLGLSLTPVLSRRSCDLAVQHVHTEAPQGSASRGPYQRKRLGQDHSLKLRQKRSRTASVAQMVGKLHCATLRALAPRPRARPPRRRRSRPRPRRFVAPALLSQHIERRNFLRRVRSVP